METILFYVIKILSKLCSEEKHPLYYFQGTSQRKAKKFKSSLVIFSLITYVRILDLESFIRNFDSLNVLIGLERNVASTVDAIDTGNSGVSKFEKIRFNLEVIPKPMKFFFCCFSFVT